MSPTRRDACFLTLDVGTTSVKAAVLDARGALLASDTREYALLTPREDIVELDPEVYWRCCREGARAALARSGVEPGRVAAVGACSQGETLIVVDGSGAPLRNAIVWIDNRSKREAEEIRQAMGGRNPTGQVDVAPTWPATRILWLKRHEPEVFRRAAKFLLVEDFILHRLSGRFVGEYSLYSSSYLLDIRRKDWWPDIMDFVGLERGRLPELHESGERIGGLTPEAAGALGLPAGTPVVSGAMDQTAAMVGAGNLRAGVVTETTGAALVVCETLDALPARNPSAMAVQYHAVPDKYFLIGWCASGGLTFKWLRDTFFGPEKERAAREGRSAYDLLTEMAAGVERGSQGLYFFPFMSGPGTLPVDPQARGVFWGLEQHHGRAHFVRAVLEALAYVLRENIEEIEALGSPCSEIRSLGGGAASPLWNRIKAEVTGRRIVTMQCPEAASLGVAMLAAVAVGVHGGLEEAAREMVQAAGRFEPDPEGARRYEEIYRGYRALERRHFPPG